MLIDLSPLDKYQLVWWYAFNDHDVDRELRKALDTATSRTQVRKKHPQMNMAIHITKVWSDSIYTHKPQTLSLQFLGELWILLGQYFRDARKLARTRPYSRRMGAAQCANNKRIPLFCEFDQSKTASVIIQKNITHPPTTFGSDSHVGIHSVASGADDILSWDAR